MQNKVAININFDSLSEAFGFPKGYRDPSYFKVFDRFNDYAEKYNFKYSIYIIGKDLENLEIASRVKEWSQQGHEIGNHTWSHPMSLGAMKRDEIKYEVMKCHEKIYDITGIEPVGFIAPAWSISDCVLDVLFENKYLYDTSYFTSLWLYPVMGKILWNHRNDKEKFKKILSRKDWLYPLYKNIQPSIIRSNDSKKLVELPLPTLNRTLLPYWHTVNFIFGEEFSRKRIDRLLKKGYFYYLLHPMDLISEEDFGDYKHSLERIDISLTKKQRLLEEGLSLLKEQKIVLMKDIAYDYIQDNI